jgi:aminopeptidase N
MLHRHHECCAGVARGVFALPGTQRQYERSVPFDLLHVELNLEVHVEEQSVAGTATWRFERRSAEASVLHFDAVAFDISQVELRSAGKWSAVPYEYDSEQLRVQLGAAVKAGEVRIKYRARPSRGLYFLGPDAHYPKRPVQVWSQCQDEDARHWFPCHDKPHVKATAQFKVRVPVRFSVLCNGTLQGEALDRNKRTHVFTYAIEQRLPSYLFTLVVGEFARVVDRPAKLPSGRQIPVEYWVPKGKEKDARRGFHRTPEMIELFSKVTGVEYPYDRYTQIVVSEFIFGGMENTTATTMYEHVLLDERAAIDIDSYDLVAHELAHQWFGDWVTCKDWSHAWLNEGFATYFEHIEREHRVGVDEYILGVERDIDTYVGETSARYSRPIVCRDYEEPIDLFDRHLYEKGGLVLHALRRELGDHDFFTAVRHYLQAHAQGNVTTEDLRFALEQQSGRSLDRFFDEWVYRAGHPNIKARVSWENQRLVVRFEQLQTHAYELNFTAQVHDAHGKLHELCGTSSERHFTLSLALKERPKHAVVDPDLRLVGSLRLEAPADFLKHQLEHAANARGRRQAARWLAGKRDYNNADLLGRVLGKKRESWTVRAACARALGEQAGTQSFAALKEHAATEAPKVRLAIAEACGRFHSAASAELLSQMLKDEKSYVVRAAITRSLGRTRQSTALAKVKAQVKQDSWGHVVAAAALDAVAALKSDQEVPWLLQHTQLGHPTRVRRSATLAVARLSDQRAVREQLEELLDDPHPHLRADVAEALALMGQPAARSALERRVSREQDGRVLRRLREVVRQLEQNDTQRELKDKVDRLERSLNEALGRLSTLEGQNAKSKP